MVRLAIDTATRWASVALSVADDVAPFEIESRSEQSHYEELPGLVEQLFAQAQVPVDSLAEIILGQGPGSFTGLRIGYGFVVGMALGRAIPVREVSSLAAIACGAWFAGVRPGGGQDRLTAILDARRGELFAQSFLCTEAGPDLGSALPARIVPSAELGDTYPGSVFVGEVEVSAVPSLLPASRIALGLLRASKDVLKPSGGDFCQNLSALSPNYLRAVAARTIAERALPSR